MSTIATQSFSGNPLNRFDEHRKDENYLLECLNDRLKPCQIIFTVMIKSQWKLMTSTDQHQTKLVYFNKTDALNITSSNDTIDLLKFTCVLLGKQDGQSFVSISLPEDHAQVILKYKKDKESNSSIMYVFDDGRTLLVKLSLKSELAIAGQVIAMASWHDANQYDGRKGLLTKPIECGMKRIAISNLGDGENATKIYPRIDPVMIACVVSPDGKQCLLGKMKKMPQGFFTCLSGFIEPCESIEEAVRREVWEESGLVIGKVEIVSSQPWPIGRSGGCELMIGCIALAITTTFEIHDSEVETVQWFPIEEVRTLLKESYARKDFKPSVKSFIPGPYAIAHHLLQLYVDRHDEQKKSKPKEGSRSYPHVEIWAGRGLFAIATIFVVSVILYDPFGYKTLELLSEPLDAVSTETTI